MVREHHWFNGPEFKQSPGDSEGQGSLAVLQSIGLQRVGQDRKIKCMTGKYKSDFY